MYYSDKPIQNVNEDSLGRANFSKILARTLFNLKTTDTFTVGLYGKWGTGKTSIVNMALQELEILQKDEPNKTVIIHFEPWQFHDSKQLLNQFLIRLANEFKNKKDKNMNDIGRALQTYSGAFAFAELIPFVGGVISNLGQKAVSQIGKKIERGNIVEKDVLEQKKHITELLEKQDAKILVVIDDIDRLCSEQIRQVFQLVASVAKFPNTAYLLVFDKEIVIKALKRVQEGNGEDYLHKIIQMPIQMPDIKESKLHNALFLNLDKIISEYSVPFFPERWNHLFTYCISPFITNLRDINRLLNSLKFKLTTISSEIEFSDMVAICAIEIGVPRIFEWIKNHKNILVGDGDIDFTTYKYTNKEWKAKYVSELEPLIIDCNMPIKGYAKTKIDVVIEALSYLFPPFAQKIGNSCFFVNVNEARKRCLVCNTDKFNRYFDFDIDDVLVKKASVDEIIFSYNSDELQNYFIDTNSQGQIYEVLKEIEAVLPEIPENRCKILFSSLANVTCRFNTKDSRGIFGQSTYTLAEHLSFDILNVISKNERYSTFAESLNDSLAISIESYANLINMVELAYGRLAANGTERTEYNKLFTLEELELLEKSFTDKCKTILEQVSLFDLPKWRMTLFLLNSFDADYTKKYISSSTNNDIHAIKYILDITSAWTGNGISYEIKESPYEFITKERIIQAIENTIASKELFNLDEEYQLRAAAFYLFHKGKVSYDGHVSQKDARTFLESKK